MQVKIANAQELSSQISEQLSLTLLVPPSNNPLVEEWDTPFGLPPFTRITPSHFKPAFDYALELNLRELKAIASNPEAPTFANTLAAFDSSAALLGKVSRVFSNLTGSLNTPELQAVETEMAGPLAVHSAKVYTYPGLFQRIDCVYEARNSSGLNAEQIRLAERIHLDFVRAGAKFSEDDKKRYQGIVEELAELSTKFQQNLLADESSVKISLPLSAMDGCPADLLSSTKQEGQDGQPDAYVMTLSRSLVVPFLTFSKDREARERLWRAWTRRGELDEKRDNCALAIKILELRRVQATMHGYKNFGEYQLADTMAKHPDQVRMQEGEKE